MSSSGGYISREEARMTSRYVDVHTHLTHEKFAGEVEAVVARATAAGLGAIVVNGLEPRSNRAIQALAARHPVIKPALGIYPIDAVNDRLPAGFPLAVERFDVDAEIAYIRAEAQAGRLAAVGECGLDGHWVGPETFARQEEVFVALLEIAMDCDLPVIIHTRKLEQRSADILKAHGARKVDFHCFGGRVKLAQACAENERWWFSIPANARNNEAFRKMLQVLPEDRILTETDAPYLGPVKGQRNEPANVVGTVELLAQERGWSVDEARERVWKNYVELFGAKWA
jgi:TatD DNase family protein